MTEEVGAGKPLTALFSGAHYRWLFPLNLCMISLATLLVSMTLFHTLVELFAVGISIMSFVVAWNTYPLSRNQFLLVLGGGYLWIGGLDLLHALSFEGINLLPVSSANTTIAFWIAARLLEALIFLIAALTLRRSVDPYAVLGIFGLLSIAASILIFTDMAPALYAESSGLTPLKVALEYGIIAVLALSALVIWRRYPRLEQHSYHRLIASITLTIIAELNFTLYTSLSDLPMVLGHLCKLVSFWLIYQVLIDASLLRPVRALSRIVDTYDAVADQSVIIDQAGIIQQANRAVREKFGEAIVGQHCHAYMHDSTLGTPECPLCEAIKNQQTMSGYEFYRQPDSTWFEASLSGITLSGNYLTMIQNNRNINKRKETESQLHTLNQLYNMRSQANLAIAASQSKAELLQKMTNIAVRYGDFTMAWIGIIDGTLVRPEYIAGADAGYLRQVQMRIDDSKWARGPVGLAAKSARVRWVNNIETDPDFEPWREAARERGYRSLAAVPLLKGAAVEGIFTLYSTTADVFTEAMIDLLTHLTEDLQTALSHLDQLEEKRQAEVQIKKLSMAIEQSANAVLIINTQGVIEYVNQGFTKLTGYTREEVFAAENPFYDLGIWDAGQISVIWSKVKRGEIWRGELSNRSKSGEQFWTWQTVSPIKDTAGQITHIVATGADNTELHHARETIEQLAYYDPLTQLANRRLLADRMKQAIADAERRGAMLAVMLFDLDDFKTINDTHGHEAGDALLVELAEVMQSSVRDQDTAARMGGDEFVILIKDVHGPEEVQQIALKILERIKQTHCQADTSLKVSSSIGIALYPHDADNPSDLLRKADLAMYRAKKTGKNHFAFFRE